jgi:hypothetical protein
VSGGMMQTKGPGVTAEALDLRLAFFRAMAKISYESWEEQAEFMIARAAHPDLSDRDVWWAYGVVERVGRLLCELSEVYREHLTDDLKALASEDERLLREEAASGQVVLLAHRAKKVFKAAVAVARAANEPDQAKRIEEAAEAALNNVVPFRRAG